MDINKLLKNVRSVDDYNSVTQEITTKCKNMLLHINITIVLALKKIRSLEIEYLNKCHENGAACILFERLLVLPPSKTWGVLAKELVNLLQYWLEAIRKHLITHNDHWWSFLKQIMKFIKDISLKNLCIPNILVDLTAECLFDIATRDTLDIYQRHDILHCLNMFSAEASRDIRLAMSSKFQEYFIKLASNIASCGYLPCQYLSLEALMRWLVLRQDPKHRASAAQQWFPKDLYPAAATEIFLNTNWMNFFQDARNFLNAVNEVKGLVTSVQCRRITIDTVVIIYGNEKQQTWLDINSEDRSMSILLRPRALKTFGVTDHTACETLMIPEDSAQTATLYREREELTIKVKCHLPLTVHPSGIAIGTASDVNIVISSRTHLRNLDKALRDTFGDKYHLLLNLDTELTLTPLRGHDTEKNHSSCEEESRFSHPLEVVKRRPHSGYVTKSQHANRLTSPSSVSTSSLAQLHDRLSALPPVRYDKETVSICAKPQLSSVTEISETDDRSFHSASTQKIKHYGVRKFRAAPKEPEKSTKNKASSDSETLKPKAKLRIHLSPIVSEDDSTSCLLVATIGSAKESVINDTLECLAKSNQFDNNNTVELVVKDFFKDNLPVTEEKNMDDIINSHVNRIPPNEETSEAIENTPIPDDAIETSKKKRRGLKKVCTVISKSTTENESNTEAINETPVVSDTERKKALKQKLSANIYNFTSDSGDEDFAKKSVKLRKRTSNGTVGSSESMVTRKTRKGRQNNQSLYTEKSCTDEVKNSKAFKSKNPAKKTIKTKKPSVSIEDGSVDLVDERIRDGGPEALDCSIVFEKDEPKKTDHVEVLFYEPPKLDETTDDQINKLPAKHKTKKRSKKANLSQNKDKASGKGKHQVMSDKEEDRTVSPLPDLETMPSCHDNTIDSFSAKTLQMFTEIYKEGAFPTNTQNVLHSHVERLSYIQDPIENTSDEVDKYKLVGNQIAKRRIIDSPKHTQPTVSMSSMSNEESDEWLPMPKQLKLKKNTEPSTSAQSKDKKSGGKLVYNTRQKRRQTVKSTASNVSCSMSASNLIEDSPPTVTINSETIANSSKTPLDESVADNVAIDKSQEYSNISLSRKTIISPIKDFESFLTDKRKTVKDRSLIKNLKHVASKDVNSDESDYVQNLQSPRSATTKVMNIVKGNSRSKTEHSDKACSSIESASSMPSSVSNWRRNMESSHSAVDTNVLAKRLLLTINQMIDTTLVKNDQNSNNLVKQMISILNMQLNMLEEKQRLFDQIRQTVIDLINAEFAKFDKRYQNLEREFAEELKEKVDELVAILKDDDKAVLDAFKSTRTDYY